MKPLPLGRWTAALCAAAAALALAGCARSLSPSRQDTNRPPTVEFVVSREGSGTHDVSWRASDPDGRVDHYLVSLDARAATQPAAGAERVALASTQVPFTRLGALHATTRAVAEPTILTVRAVDDLGAMSSPIRRAYFGALEAPLVAIQLPRLVAMAIPLPPEFGVRVSAIQPPGSRTPIESLLYWLVPESASPVPFAVIVSNPDTLRSLFAPGFGGWTRQRWPREATEATIDVDGLVPGTRYVLAVTVVDASGAYDPIFSPLKNVLLIDAVERTSGHGPGLMVSSPFGGWLDADGTFMTDATSARRAEAPPGRTLEFRVDVLTPILYGPSEVRWALDPPAVVGRHRDPDRPAGGAWTDWQPGPLTFTLGPFTDREAGRDHLLYVDGRNEIGFRSRMIVRLHVIPPPGDRRPLLVVDDTRLQVDRRDAGGAIRPPTGPWPTAAELDTFLFAGGGVPWRSYPAGTLSPQGVFAGYQADTIGTADALVAATIDLGFLLRYRNIVWLVDGGAAALTDPTADASRRMTLLREWSSSGHANPLLAFVQFGGNLWLAGGGALQAGLLPWNRGSSSVFTSPDLNPAEGELVPGRWAYDLAGWRNYIEARFASLSGIRLGASETRPGGTPSIQFPTQLLARSPATDPLPPLRGASDFYGIPGFFEELEGPNHVSIESPGGTETTLDSLYRSTPRVTGRPDRMLMTRHRLPSGGQVLMSGFPLWAWRRQDASGLVDAVLQGDWGLIRSAGATTAMNTRTAR